MFALRFVTFFSIYLLSSQSTVAEQFRYQVIAEKAEIYNLPPLGFEFNALEPYIDEKTLRSHYSGHHEAYKKKMNAALESWRREDHLNSHSTEPIMDILSQVDMIPDTKRRAIVNNGGGYVNHAFYWACLSPNPSGEDRQPTQPLLSDIEQTFGSFENFKEEFTKKSLALFGSGYVWLSRRGNDLVLSTTANQDCPLSSGLRPILVLDLWEHAYYLKHQYRRPAHVEDWWKLVDWSHVNNIDQWWKTQPHHGPRDEL